MILQHEADVVGQFHFQIIDGAGPRRVYLPLLVDKIEGRDRLRSIDFEHLRLDIAENRQRRIDLVQRLIYRPSVPVAVNCEDGELVVGELLGHLVEYGKLPQTGLSGSPPEHKQDGTVSELGERHGVAFK